MRYSFLHYQVSRPLHGVFLLAAILPALFLSLKVYNTPLVQCDVSNVVVQDFTYHNLLFRNFWSTGANIYSEKTQGEVMASIDTGCAGYSMPIGQSPLALYLHLFFSSQHIDTAYLLWIVISLSFFILASCAHAQQVSALSVLCSALLLSSVAFLDCITHGQTAILCLAIFYLLVRELVIVEKPRSDIFIVVALLLLSLKPTYLLIGVLLCSISRAYATMCVALLIGALSMFFLDFSAPFPLLSEYVNQLSRYDAHNLIHQEYWFSFEHYEVLLWVLHRYLPLETAVTLSTVLFSIYAIFITLVIVKMKRSNGITKGQLIFVFQTLTLGLFMFSPIAGRYEFILFYGATLFLLQTLESQKAISIVGGFFLLLWIFDNLDVGLGRGAVWYLCKYVIVCGLMVVSWLSVTSKKTFLQSS